MILFFLSTPSMYPKVVLHNNPVYIFFSIFVINKLQTECNTISLCQFFSICCTINLNKLEEWKANMLPMYSLFDDFYKNSDLHNTWLIISKVLIQNMWAFFVAVNKYYAYFEKLVCVELWHRKFNHFTKNILSRIIKYICNIFSNIYIHLHESFQIYLLHPLILGL